MIRSVTPSNKHLIPEDNISSNSAMCNSVYVPHFAFSNRHQNKPFLSKIWSLQIFVPSHFQEYEVWDIS
jgi:hypothetical protein